jgi:4a-hydroxytetrahydrobiopterin dehydratase
LRVSRKRAGIEAAKLGDWTLTGNVIARNFRFADFAEAMRFVNRVARAAEAANHHPDITIKYDRVRLRLTTHDEGGLTMKDFRLAARINEFVKRSGVSG